MAIWEKLFSKITFKDYPDTSTPLNASNMNALSNAIDGIDNRVVELNSNLSYKGSYTGNIDELLGVGDCGGYVVVSSNASGTQPFTSASYYLELPIQSNGRTQRAVHIVTGEVKERFYSDNKWYPWTSNKANAPIRIATQTEIPPSESVLIPYDNSISYTTCEIMFFAYGGYRQTVKIPMTSTVIKFMTSNTEWGGTFGTSVANGGLVITNNSDKQKVVITHIYLIP